MTAKHIFNRFDEYEISSVFSDSTAQYLDKHFTPVRRKFYIKCLLGLLLAFSAYFSHWGPLPWPKNYYLIIFSIIFYHVASTVIGRLSTINEGSVIGEYKGLGTAKIFTIKTQKDKERYTISMLDASTKKLQSNKTFIYLDYFTTQGTFKEDRFHKDLSNLISNTV